MTNKIRIKVSANGDHIGDAEYDQDVIKIGKLKSSHMHFDHEQVARMHAVLERGSEGYRLIDLGSSTGSSVNGQKINKNATLPKKGTMGFGPFVVEYELDDGPAAVDLSSGSSNNITFQTSDTKDQRAQEEAELLHHRGLFESLVVELERLQSSAINDAKKMLATWRALSQDRRRKLIRIFIAEIRSCRKAQTVMERKRIATMLNLGMDGMEAIYKMDPEDALMKAHETLMDMAISKTAMEMLVAMGLGENMKKAFAQLPPDEQKKQGDDFKGFMGAHEKLADRLQNSIVAAGSLIPAYLSRAGGREATDEDRFQWKMAFDQIKKAQQTSEANEA